MLTKYGTDNIIVMLSVAVLLILLAIFVFHGWFSIIISIFGVLLALFTFLFFRDPDRTVPVEAIANNAIIIAPADGKIVEIKEVQENIFIHSNAIRISIFLSPLDVHVNRSPVSGIVKYFKYFPGDYLVAYHPKSSEKNEQTHIGVENEHGKVFFKQIVGILARRLVWDIKEGDTLKVGQKFGMMKFGSRMDVIISIDSEIYVNIGDRVTAGETFIAKIINK